jgi:hypothetical protein
MSIGNLKDTGNQGNNLPFQWKVLQGLQAILDEVAQPLTCVEDSIGICDAQGHALNINTNGSINTVIQNAAGTSVTTTTVGADTGLDVNIIGPISQTNMAGSVSVTLANNQLGIARTTGMLRPNNIFGDVNTAAGIVFFSVSVANVGAANGTVLGELIKPGEVLNFSADAVNNYFTTFAYDATGTEFIIIYVA